MAAARVNRQRSSLPAFDAFVEKNQNVEAQSEAFSEEASEAAASIASGGKRTVILVAVIALLLATACAGVITRGITRGVAVILERLASLRDSDTTDLSTGLSAVATGDLTHSVAVTTAPLDELGGDEIGRIAAPSTRFARTPRARSTTTTRCARGSPS